MTLSILIPSTNDRAVMTAELVRSIQAQGDVQILTAFDNGETPTGTKRNQLLAAAIGDYIAFVDSDDQVSAEYIPAIIQALQYGPDCVGFKGWITTRRARNEWIISNCLPYVDATIAGKIVYLRHTNHLAPVRRELAIQAGFPDVYRQEDWEYAKRLRPLLTTEVFIDKHLYTYRK